MDPLAASTRSDIRQALEDNIVRRPRRKTATPSRFGAASTSTDDHYICVQDINSAWSGRNKLANALRPAHLNYEQIEKLKQKALKFLSILVYIEAHTYLDNFSRNFFSPDGNLRYSDDELPFDDDIVERPVEGLAERYETLFLQYQYLFLPVRDILTFFELVELRSTVDHRGFITHSQGSMASSFTV